MDKERASPRVFTMLEGTVKLSSNGVDFIVLIAFLSN